MRIQTGQTGLLLASASPRRRELLGGLGLSFEVVAPAVEEAVRPAEEPRRYVERLAGEKARAVASRHPGCLALAADTTVVLEGEILGKPADELDAARMLRSLSGRWHMVLTGVALAGPAEGSCVVETRVCFRALTEEQIAWYIRTGEPMDKAGSYAIQGRGGAFVEAIEGSASNVVGLPLAETIALLEGAGVPMPWRES